MFDPAIPFVNSFCRGRTLSAPYRIFIPGGVRQAREYSLENELSLCFDKNKSLTILTGKSVSL